MAKIIINGKTHRAACTDGGSASDVVIYDSFISNFFTTLAEFARRAGFDLEVDAAGEGAASYRVTGEADYADLQAAHDFMQSHAADFWANY